MKTFLRVIVICFAVCGVAAACAAKDTENSSSSYSYTIALSGNVFGFSDEVVPPEQIDKLIGEAKSIVSGSAVLQDGDIHCAQPDCKAPPGTTFYSIRDVAIQEAIAVKLAGENQYRKCVWIKKR